MGRDFWNAMLLLIIAWGFLGCRHYELGTPRPSDFQTVAIGRIENRTKEPRLAGYLRSKLAAAFNTEGSLKVVPVEQADRVIHAVVTDYHIEARAAVKLQEGEDQTQTYRTEIFGVRVEVEYALEGMPEGRGAAMQRVTGQAEFTEQVDLEVSRQRGFRIAIADAAGRIARDVAEPW